LLLPVPAPHRKAWKHANWQSRRAGDAVRSQIDPGTIQTGGRAFTGLVQRRSNRIHEGQTALDRGAKLTDIQEYVAEGSASLKKAEEIAQVSRTILGETNEARAKALKVGADKLGEPYMRWKTNT
jgi:hypothetical protein